MQYNTSFERQAFEEGEALGLRNGIAVCLEIKFGAPGLELVPVFGKVADLNWLHTFLEAIRSAASVDDLRPLFYRRGVAYLGYRVAPRPAPSVDVPQKHQGPTFTWPK